MSTTASTAAALPQLFDWPTARQAAVAGWQVRRVGWTNQSQWLMQYLGGLFWLVFTDGVTPSRVVQASDFGSVEFLAQDWTNLPASCVTAGTTPGAGNGCPLPFSPTPVTTTGTTATGTSTPVSQTPVSPSQIPSAGGSGGGTSGGGSSSSSDAQKNPQQSPHSWPWPSLSITAIESTSQSCLVYDGTPTVTGLMFTGSVSLSNPSGYSGPGIFFVTVNAPDGTVLLTTTNANRYAFITVTDSNHFTYTITSQTATGAGTATVKRYPSGNAVNTLVTRGATLTTN